MKRVFLMLTLAVTLCLGLSKDEIKTTMQQKIAVGMEIMQEKSSNEAKATKIFVLFDEYFDYGLMTRISLSNHYKNLTKSQIKQFEEAFENRLRESFIKQLSLYNGQTMKIVDEIFPNEKRVVLKSELVGKDKNYNIDFKFYPKGKDNWLIYDVDILGVSIVATYRSQFADLANNVSFEEMLNKLKATDVEIK